MAAIESGTVIGPESQIEWLAERRKSLGASEAAAAIGVSPWEGDSPIDLWQRKVGLAPEKEESEAMLWGRLHEPSIAAQYEARTGRRLGARQLFMRHPEHPFLTATLDGVACDGRIVEIKTASAWSKGWGDEDSDEIPDNYLVQIAQQMAVTGAEKADVAVLIGGNRLRIFEGISRDERLIREVVGMGIRFWSCVTSRTPPSWGRVTAQTLAVLHPECEGEVELGEDVAKDVLELDLCNASMRSESTARDEAKLRVLRAMGNHRLGRLPDGRVVKRYLEEVKERTTVTKAHTRHFFRILKGDQT